MLGDLFGDDPAEQWEERETEEEARQRVLYGKLETLRQSTTPFWERLLQGELLLKLESVPQHRFFVVQPALHDLYRVVRQDGPALASHLESLHDAASLEGHLAEARRASTQLDAMQEPIASLVRDISEARASGKAATQLESSLEEALAERDRTMSSVRETTGLVLNKAQEVLTTLSFRKSQLDKWTEDVSARIKALVAPAHKDNMPGGSGSAVSSDDGALVSFVFGPETPGKEEHAAEGLAIADSEKRLSECLNKISQETLKCMDDFLGSAALPAVTERLTMLTSYTKFFRFKRAGRKKTQRVLGAKVAKLQEELEELLVPFEESVEGLKRAASLVATAYAADGPLVAALEKRVEFCKSALEEQERRKKALDDLQEKYSKRGEILRAVQLQVGKVVQAKSKVLDVRLELERLKLFGAPPLTMEHTEMQLVKAEKGILKQEHAEREAREFLQEIRSAFPEVDLAASMAPIQRRRLQFTGKEMNRCRSDYDDLETLSDRVKRCRLADGTQVILKEYRMVEDERTYRTVISALHDLDHANVVKLTGYFFEGDNVYLEFPHHPSGTLGAWLRSKRDEMAKRSVFYLILQALHYLHDQGIVHANLSLDSVVFDASMRPVLVDFDHCVPAKYRHLYAGAQGAAAGATPAPTPTSTGRDGFVAPEVLDGAEPGPSSDMWSFGVIMYKAQAGLDREVLVMGNALRDFQLGSSFQDEDSWLVTVLLCLNPSQRMSAHEAMCHPYFTQPTVDYLRSKGQLLHPETKVRAARTHLSVTRQRNEPIFGIESVELSIDSSNICESVFRWFAELLEDGWRMPLELNMDGDSDFPRNLTRVYNKFFTHLHTNNAFESHSPGQQFVLPTQSAGSDRMQLVGKTMVKVVLDGRLLPFKAFAPSLYKFLCGNPVTFEDLEVFHPQRAAELRSLLTEPNAESKGLNFGSVGGDSSQLVNDKNKHTYVEQCVNWILVDSRRPALNQIKNGFRWCTRLMEMDDTLGLLSWSEMRSFLCGNIHATVEDVMGAFCFPEGNPKGDRAKALLEETLRYWVAERRRGMMRKLITYLTGFPALPLGHMYNPTVAAMMEEKLRVRVVEGSEQNLTGEWNTCECSLGADSPMLSSPEAFRTALETDISSFLAQLQVPQEVHSEEEY